MKTIPTWSVFSLSIWSLPLVFISDDAVTAQENNKINTSSMSFTTKECGTFGEKNYKMYFKNDNSLISPFHDIPLYHDEREKLFHMVVEIPRGTQAKMEISKADVLNPITQDVADGNLRYVNVPYIHNYGAFPQTWEDPTQKDQITGYIGDNDPIDVVEIGKKVAFRGEILTVKVLGIFALIDQGETDWKVVTIDVNDPDANSLNDVSDVEQKFPSLLNDMKTWFKEYKKPKLNHIGLNEEIKNHEYALGVINTTHQHWKRLVLRPQSINTTIQCENLTVDGSPFKKLLDDIHEIPKECLL